MVAAPYLKVHIGGGIEVGKRTQETVLSSATRKEPIIE
jgi:hypothetical protein